MGFTFSPLGPEIPGGPMLPGIPYKGQQEGRSVMTVLNCLGCNIAGVLSHVLQDIQHTITTLLLHYDQVITNMYIPHCLEVHADPEVLAILVDPVAKPKVMCI